MNLSPIENTTVVKEVLNRITEAIRCGNLKSGDKLPTEAELCMQLGAGRNSVREAIKMLSAMGVIEVRRGQGTYLASTVSPEVFNPLIFSMLLRPNRAEDLYELRIMFEGMVLLVLMDKVDAETMEPIWNYVAEVEQHLLSGNKDAEFFVQADLGFHRLMLAATGNPLIERIGQTVTELFVDVIRKSLDTEDGVEDSIRNHRSLLTLVKEKNREEVFATIAKTLSRWRQQLPK